MARKLYPIGIQTFEEIRRLDNLYIDKTAYVYHMTHTDGKFFFLSRPRRFGKSLLVSTFKSYFEGRKDLFEGLAIEKLETEWESYPVLHFDMHIDDEVSDVDVLNCCLLENLVRHEQKYGIVSDCDMYGVRLGHLISKVYQLTGHEVVVLIDNYDDALLKALSDEDQFVEVSKCLASFLVTLKSEEPHIRFMFMTGITKYSQGDMFGGFNCVTDVSMNGQYAGICGITKDELLTQMSEDVDEFAATQGLSREETISELTDMYDGYHFTWPSSDVFNPFSLLNCFAKQVMGAYWFGTGTPTYLINMMRKFHVQPSQLGRTKARAASFDVATETMLSLTPLLYQSGYLTIKDYDRRQKLYTLDIPNREIAVGLFDSLLPGYLAQGTDEGRVVIAETADRLNYGDAEGAMQLLADFFATVPYCDNTNYEGHWQQVLYIIFALLTDFDIHVEQHTAKGRIDITLETATTVYVMELKLNGSVEDALAQIESKHYADAFKMQSKPVVKVGMNFALKDGVNTFEWQVVSH